tara:strand:+ start:42 stop:278 length:237 start_codon:yes stop_codon:yes gene_type:complete
MTIKTLGMGIAKVLTKDPKKKILSLDRIADINKKLRNTPDRSKILPTDNQKSNIKQDVFEDHIDEVKAIYDKHNKGKK